MNTGDGTIPHLVGYMESHDEERLMYKNLSYGNSSGYYNIQERNTALERLALAGAFFFTGPRTQNDLAVWGAGI